MSSNASSDRAKSPAPRIVPPSWIVQDEARQLPVSLTSFVGRDHEIAAVIELLHRPDVRMLTLIGTGGIGKTRLALRVAEQLASGYEDGSAFVSLASIRDPALVPKSIAETLAVPDAAGLPISKRLQRYLAPLHLLLVVDNFEHLVDAAPVLNDLLRHCPRVNILCTSRVRLAVSGEQLFAVPSMRIPDILPDESIDRVANVESVQLFLQRARAQMPGFSLTPENMAAIAEISRKVDGLPLAIELVASRAAVLSPASLLSRLSHRLNLLTDGPRDVPMRLRSMRDAISWSYDLLSESEQVVFRKLGVFIDGFTQEAADAIANYDVLTEISAVVANSLLNVVSAADGEPRFVMLETIREFALEQLAATRDEFPVHLAHATYYTNFAESALPFYDGPELMLYRTRVQRERENCRAAMRWALDNDEAETAVRLAGALWRVWWVSHPSGRKHWHDGVQEGRDWIEQALAHSRDLPAEAVAEALIGACAFNRLQGDVTTAQEYAEELLRRSRAAQYAYGTYWALYILGQLVTAHEWRGTTFELDDPADKENGHPPNEALGRRLFRQALDLAASIRNPENHTAIVLERLAALERRAGAWDEAANCLSQAADLSRKTGNPHVLARSLVGYAQVLRHQGNYRSAAQILGEAALSLVNQPDLSGVHSVLVELALISSRLGQTERTIHFLAAAEHLPSHAQYQESHDQLVTRAIVKLGQSAFSSIWDAHHPRSLEEILNDIEAFAASIPDSRHAVAVESHRGLSPREVDVLRNLAEGLTNRDIAERLSLSERTVENHVLHILTKLDLGSRTAAAIYALRQGLT
jgi:predicted ATPase/DNA-binding CsgD family transcriptional regulator